MHGQTVCPRAGDDPQVPVAAAEGTHPPSAVEPLVVPAAVTDAQGLFALQCGAVRSGEARSSARLSGTWTLRLQVEAALRLLAPPPVGVFFVMCSVEIARIGQAADLTDLPRRLQMAQLV